MKKNVAILMGGYTEEAKVSLKSGELVYNNIDRTLYNLYKVHVLTDGWNCVIGKKKYPINKTDFSTQIEGETVQFDLIFNIIHGTPGEDGHLQAFFETIEIPYTGCGFYQSAITFNKKDCISVLSKYDIPSALSVYINQEQSYNVDEIIATVGLPCFVKPNESGSSLGISKVHNKEEFPKALDFAFAEDKDVLIESFLDGTEVSIGVINYQGKTKVLGITEIITENDFFDYEAKYEGKSEEITPARLDDITTKKVEAIAIKVYESLGMTGLSRSEFIIVKGIPYFLEINTIPGLSPQSILPQQADYAGIALVDLFGNELELALKRKSKWNA